MTDVFRKAYLPIGDDQKSKINDIKNKAEELYFSMTDLGGMTVDPRAMALAKTNLEQAVMWAVKAIT
jgi:hypothetical protein